MNLKDKLEDLLKTLVNLFNYRINDQPERKGLKTFSIVTQELQDFFFHIIYYAIIMRRYSFCIEQRDLKIYS